MFFSRFLDGIGLLWPRPQVCPWSYFQHPIGVDISDRMFFQLEHQFSWGSKNAKCFIILIIPRVILQSITKSLSWPELVNSVTLWFSHKWARISIDQGRWTLVIQQGERYPESNHSVSPEMLDRLSLPVCLYWKWNRTGDVSRMLRRCWHSVTELIAIMNFF